MKPGRICRTGPAMDPRRAPPNGSRLSCGALKKDSFPKFYARRQLQALVRRRVHQYQSHLGTVPCQRTSSNEGNRRSQPPKYESGYGGNGDLN